MQRGKELLMPGSVPAPVHRIEGFRGNTQHFCRMLHHHVMYQVLEFLDAPARLLNHAPVDGNHRPVLDGGGGVGTHGGSGCIGRQLLQVRRDFIDAKADAIQGLAPDVVQPLRGVQHHVIKAVRPCAVTRMGGEHHFAPKTPPVAVSAAHHKASARGRRALVRAGIRLSQPDRKT